MTNKQHTEELNEMELMWTQRTNALVRSAIAYCKELQEKEAHIYKTTETPVIHALDNVILELQKYKLNIQYHLLEKSCCSTQSQLSDT